MMTMVYGPNRILTKCLIHKRLFVLYIFSILKLTFSIGHEWGKIVTIDTHAVCCPEKDTGWALFVLDVVGLEAAGAELVPGHDHVPHVELHLRRRQRRGHLLYRGQRDLQ